MVAVESGISEAQALFNKKQFGEAAKSLDSYIRNNPRGEEASSGLLMLGRCYAQMDGPKSERSLRTFESLIFKFPQSPESVFAYSELISAYSKQGRPDQVEKALGQMARAFPHHAETFKVEALIADGHFEKKQFKQAQVLYDEAATGLSENQKQRLRLCLVYLNGQGGAEGLFTAAQETFERAPAEAASLYETFLKEAGKSSNANQARTRLGYCYSRMPDIAKREQAEALWREVILRGPPSDEWVQESRWYLIQRLAGPKNEWKKAISELDQLIASTKPTSFRHEQAMFTKAWLYWANNQWGEAAKNFQALIDQYPSKQKHTPIQFYLSDSQSKAKG